MATSPLLLFLLLVAAAAAAGDEASLSPSNAAAPAAPVLVGGRTEIRDVGGNKAVQSLGRFAVAEHNRRLRHGGSGGPADPVPVKLAFARVVEAQKQVVSGVAYYLKVAVRDPRGGAGGGGDRVFDAVVVVKAWLKSKELVSFKPAASTK